MFWHITPALNVGVLFMKIVTKTRENLYMRHLSSKNKKNIILIEMIRQVDILGKYVFKQNNSFIYTKIKWVRYSENAKMEEKLFSTNLSVKKMHRKKNIKTASHQIKTWNEIKDK